MAQYGWLAADFPKLLFPVDAVSRLKWQRFRAAANSVKKLAFAVDFWMTKRYENRIYAQFDGVLIVSEADASYAAALRSLPPATEAHLPNQEVNTGDNPPELTLCLDQKRGADHCHSHSFTRLTSRVFLVLRTASLRPLHLNLLRSKGPGHGVGEPILIISLEILVKEARSV